MSHVERAAHSRRIQRCGKRQGCRQRVAGLGMGELQIAEAGRSAGGGSAGGGRSTQVGVGVAEADGGRTRGEGTAALGYGDDGRGRHGCEGNDAGGLLRREVERVVRLHRARVVAGGRAVGGGVRLAALVGGYADGDKGCGGRADRRAARLRQHGLGGPAVVAQWQQLRIAGDGVGVGAGVRAVVFHAIETEIVVEDVVAGVDSLAAVAEDASAAATGVGGVAGKCAIAQCQGTLVEDAAAEGRG